LRDRTNDIPLLATHFISLICRRLKRLEANLTQTNLRQLQNYHWPGNIRELQNVIERAIILSPGKRLEFNLTGEPSTIKTTPEQPAEEKAPKRPYTETQRRARDRTNILAALRLSNGKISGEGGAAQLLGIKSTTLASRIKSLGLGKQKL
jgi:transcriptional regulator with GAF, ATPase, and Fis domain